MGDLKKKMPVTFLTFLIGTLALSGVPPFSGFYLEDSILGQALEQHNICSLPSVPASPALTTFYMFRLFYVAFLGNAKTPAAEHAHESPPVMAWPLRVLGVFAFIGGVIGINNIYGAQFSGESGAHFVVAQYYRAVFECTDWCAHRNCVRGRRVFCSAEILPQRNDRSVA